MKVESKNRRLGERLIKTLINPPIFELGLMFSAKRTFLSVTPPNDFRSNSFGKSVSFVQSNMSKKVSFIIGTFSMVLQKVLVIIIYT